MCRRQGSPELAASRGRQGAAVAQQQQGLRQEKNPVGDKAQGKAGPLWRLRSDSAAVCGRRPSGRVMDGKLGTGERPTVGVRWGGSCKQGEGLSRAGSSRRAGGCRHERPSRERSQWHEYLVW